MGKIQAKSETEICKEKMHKKVHLWRREIEAERGGNGRGKGETGV